MAIMWSSLRRNKTVMYGVPMLILVIGGSFGLREFTKIRYDAQKIKKKLDPALEARIENKKEVVSLEYQYKKIEEVNVDDWKNIRGPRPWEDSKQYQQQQRERLNSKPA
ncbi:cytochrome c oxidase assembly protein COX16 homolog, mitochondrial [Protopterus annectens]|uniref:cytochrome c oxidase assembly protein COX16 homolog, mitochondrial n=1 Tax=Protopterus annectens TaxID=7888 RepID=UPI001CFB9307|nr:cytochrome c oxidase assembly protein COX16 homolog, mitochondrial [Protopterus annectens]